MNRSLALLVIGLVFGAGAGFLLAAANGVTLDGHDHAADDKVHLDAVDGAAHDHSNILDLPAGESAPTVAIDLAADPEAGWNLRIDTTGFTFAPANVGRAHVPREGHAHVYANGAKLARVYGKWFHIGALPEGEIELRVTLNANDHRALSVAGVPVAARVTLANTQ